MERRRERLFSRIKSPETNPAEAECTYHRSSPAPMQSSACEARQEFINHQIRREWFPPRNHGGGACGLRQKCGAGPLPPHRRRPVCSGRNNALAGGCQNADASVGFYGDAELDLKREHPRRNDSCLEAPARGISGNWGHYRDTVGQSVALLLVARLMCPTQIARSASSTLRTWYVVVNGSRGGAAGLVADGADPAAPMSERQAPVHGIRQMREPLWSLMPWQGVPSQQPIGSQNPVAGRQFTDVEKQGFSMGHGATDGKKGRKPCSRP